MDQKTPQNNNDPNRPSHLQDEKLANTNLEQEQPSLEDTDRDEETASELGVANYGDTFSSQSDDQDEDFSHLNSFVGWAGLALSVLSFFVFPIILGGAGIVVGFIARSKQAEWLGNIAIAAGIISIAVRLFIAPFV